MALLTEDRRISWPGGTVLVPVAEAAYEAFGADENPHKSIVDDFGALAGSQFDAPALVAGRYCEFNFGLEFLGSDTTDVPSILGTLLRACGMTETPTDSGTKTEFAYTCPDPIVSVPTDLRYFDNGIEWIMKNMLGSFVLDAPAGHIPTITFNWRGNVDPSNPVEAEQAAPTAFATKVAAYPVQGNAFTITPAGAGAITPDCLHWTIDLGNNIYPSPNVGGDFGFDIPEILKRNTMATLRIEVDDLDAFNPTDYFLNRKELVVTTFLEDGQGDGHECAVTFGGVIPERPTYTRNEDATIYEFQIKVTRGNGLSLVWLEI